jgi:hypothetical protein
MNPHPFEKEYNEGLSGMGAWGRAGVPVLFWDMTPDKSVTST